MIGDDIEVSILSVAGDKVRIGIDAPRDIAVFRKEVYIAIDKGSAPAGDASRHFGRLGARQALLAADDPGERLEHDDHDRDRGRGQGDDEDAEAHPSALLGLDDVPGA